MGPPNPAERNRGFQLNAAGPTESLRGPISAEAAHSRPLKRSTQLVSNPFALRIASRCQDLAELLRLHTLTLEIVEEVWRDALTKLLVLVHALKGAR